GQACSLSFIPRPTTTGFASRRSCKRPVTAAEVSTGLFSNRGNSYSSWNLDTRVPDRPFAMADHRATARGCDGGVRQERATAIGSASGDGAAITPKTKTRPCVGWAFWGPEVPGTPKNTPAASLAPPRARQAWVQQGEPSALGGLSSNSKGGRGGPLRAGRRARRRRARAHRRIARTNAGADRRSRAAVRKFTRDRARGAARTRAGGTAGTPRRRPRVAAVGGASAEIAAPEGGAKHGWQFRATQMSLKGARSSSVRTGTAIGASPMALSDAMIATYQMIHMAQSPR